MCSSAAPAWSTSTTGDFGRSERAASSKYHDGMKPTRSSPASTSSTSSSSKSITLTPVTGENLALQTLRSLLSGQVAMFSFRKCRKRWPQSKHSDGSHAPGFPRTSRGICMVLKLWMVLTCPCGVRNPTTISCHESGKTLISNIQVRHTGTPRRKDWK